MRYSQSEKMEVIKLVEESTLSVRRTLRELEINRSTFYAWYRRYAAKSKEVLESYTKYGKRASGGNCS